MEGQVGDLAATVSQGSKQVSIVPTRVAALLAILATIAVSMPRAALASPTFSDWPSRDVTIIVPFPAGSADDVAARLYAHGLSRRWTRRVIVENKPGSDAVVVRAAFAGADDDHTLLYATSSTIIVSPLLRGPARDRSSLDVVPIAPGASTAVVVAVANHVPAQSLKELVEFVRSKPGELTWASGPSLPYFTFAATVRRHQLDMAHVAHRDDSTLERNLNEGRVHALCQPFEAVAGPVERGKARILAVTSPQREAMLPDVPTVAEAGFPEMEVEDLSGLFGRRRHMPPELRDRIAADMRAVAADAAFHEWLAANGQRVRTGTPAEFAAAIGRQRIRIQQIMHIIDAKSAAK
jgi:tripartite-type tricarboxylate transporter receptor subunit TctC